MSTARRLAAALVTGAVLLVVPSGTTAPATMSLVAVETASAVDFDEGVVWVLALGSDSRTAKPLEGNADAIELIALDVASGRAVALGIARDSYVDIDGHGPDKITTALYKGGPQLVAAEVAELTGVTPQYVFTTGFAGFEGMVDSIGELRVHSDVALQDSEYQLDVHVGENEMDGLEATGFARSRNLPASDFGRQANQQRLLEAILDSLRTHQDEEGFLEAGALAALQHLDTDLSPTELYRFAQAVTQINLRRTATCVIGGTDDTVDGAAVIHLDEAQARRLAADAADDARLQHGCS